MYKRAQARIIEAILASFIIFSSLLISSNYLQTNAVNFNKNQDDRELASGILSYLIQSGIATDVYNSNYNRIIDLLEKAIPPDYGYRIEVYDENLNLLWYHQRNNFDKTMCNSSYIILNGKNGTEYTNMLIIVLCISK
ncbi:MAG: hypothetical protein RQ922_04980 [Thermoproteota archaeon]|jgi:hypothetical protein|nr:hypothetical protein [Thermoproteota archaeon]